MSNISVARFLKSSTPPHISTLIVLAGIGALSMNVFLPTLPQMTSFFGTDYRIMQLSVALYLGVSAVVQIIIGPISDRYGRRPVILWALAIFILASVGCLLATNITTFLIFRMLQASVVGGLAISRAAVRDMVPTDQAASMIGYVTMGMSLVPMLGPSLGGALGETYGWQSNFWMLLVLGGLVFAITWFDMGETAAKSCNTLGAQFREYPTLLKSPLFWGYSLSAGFAAGSFFAYLGGAPFIGEKIFGLSPSMNGLYFGAPALGYLIGNFFSGRYAMRFGINKLILVGTIASAVGILVSLIVFGFGYGSAPTFFGFMAIVGLGNGLVIPNANAGLLSARPSLAGSAAGLGGAMIVGAGAALSAIASLILRVETGATPVLWMMLVCAACSIIAIIWVIRRNADLY